MVKKRLDEATRKRVCVGRLYKKGKKPAEVAHALGVSRQTVYTWKLVQGSGGIDAQRAMPEPGRPTRLDESQLKDRTAPCCILTPSTVLTPRSPCPTDGSLLSCLCGSERVLVNDGGLHRFLSCLCGSERRLHPGLSVFDFLSCLCGSERQRRRNRQCDPFLSCLCGSELAPKIAELAKDFLSCLCGSEHGPGAFTDRLHFLSCLCGSELQRVRAIGLQRFLSCLCGSERGKAGAD